MTTHDYYIAADFLISLTLAGATAFILGLAIFG